MTQDIKMIPKTQKRIFIRIFGAVQGVGFRPFVYNLAKENNLFGWVKNSNQGISIEAEGEYVDLQNFLLLLEQKRPSHSSIQSLEASFLDPIGYKEFEIKESSEAGDVSAFVMPDIATCPNCLREVFNPLDRRYRYPFINCTNCGPRFSITRKLPYDRERTSMKSFDMCPECRSEYEDPKNRRFHAEPNACPKCGPQVELIDREGNFIANKDEAVQRAVQLIQKGKIIAIKGLGGFHLVTNACLDEAVINLRERKERDEKPFAVMMPTVSMTKFYCEMSLLEERLLLSSVAPIVLLNLKKNITAPFQLSSEIAPRNPYLGVMLPHTPLHHLLARQIGFPIIATSGNISEEPIITDNSEAFSKLGKVADFFLMHDRPILTHVDDSLARIIKEREFIIRRSRGYAPLPIHLEKNVPEMIAFGAHIKNTVAVSKNKEVFISQHIGDLGSFETFKTFKEVILKFKELYNLAPTEKVCDIHPDYKSTQFAKEEGGSLKYVQHHLSHVFSCMAENQVKPPFLGVAWDGTGLGFDGAIWGGEFFNIKEKEFRRVAAFDYFKLPGSEKAVKEPRRSGLGLLYKAFGESVFDMEDLDLLGSFSGEELKVLKEMLKKDLKSPLTSSVGRIFDGVSAILGICQISNFEGQGAMELEYSISDSKTDETYPFNIKNNTDKKEMDTDFIIDWVPAVRTIVEDVKSKIKVCEIARKFHNTLSKIIVDIALLRDEKKVLLTGGCFQNKYLLEKTIEMLEEKKVKVYWHQRVPTNDGGISLGQIVGASLCV